MLILMSLKLSEMEMVACVGVQSQFAWLLDVLWNSYVHRWKMYSCTCARTHGKKTIGTLQCPESGTVEWVK